MGKINMFFLGSVKRKLIIGLLVIALFLLVFEGISTYYINTLSSNAKEHENVLTNLQKTSELNNLAQSIKYYDEILTQSARNYAFYKLARVRIDEISSEGPNWKERYYETEPVLDKIIKEALIRGDEIDRGIFLRIDKSNTALVQMEHESIEATDRGDYETAVEILDSKEYWNYKKEYQTALYNYVERKKESQMNTSVFSIEAAQQMQFETSKILTQSKNITFGLFLIFLLIISGFGTIIISSISEPIKKLTQATQEIKKRNFKTIVKLKTKDEFEELGNAFNLMSKKLLHAEEQRTQVNKAKTQFLGITSHELRSPMTPMKAQLQMLGEGYFGKLSRKQKESIRIVIRNTNQLDKLLLDFLEISRIEAGRLNFDFKKTNITKVIQETVQLMHTYLPEKKIQIITKITNIPIIESDPNRLSQVIRNLIGNAIKFSEAKKIVEISAKKTGKYVLFSIKDQGIGITRKNQKSLFQPFHQVEQTLNRNVGGTGLGLAICKGIVQSQGGQIWVKSTIGKGSIFYFTIPIRPKKTLANIKSVFNTLEHTPPAIFI